MEQKSDWVEDDEAWEEVVNGKKKKPTLMIYKVHTYVVWCTSDWSCLHPDGFQPVRACPTLSCSRGHRCRPRPSA